MKDDKTPQEENNDPLAPTPVSDSGDHKITVLEEELAKAKDHLLRALADTENTRKRALKEREDATKYAISSFARDLLDFADNFHRALESIPDELKNADERISNVISGIEAMEKEFLRVFEKNGIRKIEPLDQIFDPNFHEVLFETPGTGKPGGTIIQVIEAGYMIKDRLLRPARVGVAKSDGTGAPPASGGHIDTQA